MTIEQQVMELEQFRAGEDITARQVMHLIHAPSRLVSPVLCNMVEKGLAVKWKTPSGGTVYRKSRKNKWLTSPWVSWTPERAGEWAR